MILKIQLEEQEIKNIIAAYIRNSMKQQVNSKDVQLRVSISEGEADTIYASISFNSNEY